MSGRPSPSTRRLGALAVALAFLAACSGSPSEPQSTSSVPAKRPTSTATIAITKPANGSTVAGPTVHVEMSLKGGKLVATTSQNLKPDEGHLHLKLDNELISMTGGLTSDIPNVKPGTHVVEVEYVASDHSPFEPRVFAGNSFIVR